MKQRHTVNKRQSERGVSWIPGRRREAGFRLDVPNLRLETLRGQGLRGGRAASRAVEAALPEI